MRRLNLVTDCSAPLRCAPHALRTASALQFMRDTGLQVLLATPPDKSGALLQHVVSARTVVRKDGHSFVIEIDKHEMVRELEGK